MPAASSQQIFFKTKNTAKKPAQYFCIVFITVNKITPWKVVKLLVLLTLFSSLPRRFAFRGSPSLLSSGFVPRVWLGFWLRLEFWLRLGFWFQLGFSLTKVERLHKGRLSAQQEFRPNGMEISIEVETLQRVRHSAQQDIVEAAKESAQRKKISNKTSPKSILSLTCGKS